MELSSAALAAVTAPETEATVLAARGAQHTHTEHRATLWKIGPATVSVTKHYPDGFFCNEATKEKS